MVNVDLPELKLHFGFLNISYVKTCRSPLTLMHGLNLTQCGLGINTKAYRHTKIRYILQFWAKNRERWSSNAHSVKQHAVCIRDRLAEDYNLTSIQLYFDIWCSLNGRFQQRYHVIIIYLKPCDCISLSLIYSLGYWAVFSNPAVQLFSCKRVTIKLSWVIELIVRWSTGHLLKRFTSSKIAENLQ